ncbi:MAG: glycosyltransferase [Porticoccaceae bacterium]|nr:glycosyltransferase [Porticoccaceae bacterium]
MSAFNAEGEISEAIESILAQTYSDFKFIIVNNCSSDSTAEIINSYAKVDSRITTVHLSQPGTYIDGRNAGIALVTTDWFAVMDADDVAEPERLSIQHKYITLKGEHVAVFGTWATVISGKGDKLGKMKMGPVTESQFHSLFSKNEAIVPLDPSTIIKKDIFLLSGGYRAEAVPAADLDLWYRIAEIGGIIQIIPELLMQYRIHGGSTSVRQSMLQRLKTHYINFNMRRRRSGMHELTWDQYNSQIWTKWTYRLPRRRNDYGLVFYKFAGFSYSNGSYLKLFLYLSLSFLFKPVHVIKNVIKQKMN